MCFVRSLSFFLRKIIRHPFINWHRHKRTFYGQWFLGLAETQSAYQWTFWSFFVTTSLSANTRNYQPIWSWGKKIHYYKDRPVNLNRIWAAFFFFKVKEKVIWQLVTSITHGHILASFSHSQFAKSNTKLSNVLSGSVESRLAHRTWRLSRKSLPRHPRESHKNVR